MEFSYYLQKLKRLPPEKLFKILICKSLDFLYHSLRKIKLKIKPIKLSDEELIEKTNFRGSVDELISWIDDRKKPLFFIGETKKEEIVKLMKRRYTENVKKTIKKADEICEHKFDLLGSGPTLLGKKINWHEDFKVKKIWPFNYYKDIDIILLDEPCDVKVPWELNRFHHFITLGKAYWYTKNEKYAKEFVSQFKDWVKENPVDFGVNWVLSMEVAIRAVNLIWTYYFFKKSKFFTKDVKKEFLKNLYFHTKHILDNIEYGLVKANHYLSNGVGLIYIGIMFPEFKESKEWIKKGLEIVLDSMKNQVFDDGVSFEKSVHYHRLVADFFLHVYLLSKMNGLKLPEWYVEKLERMIEFIAYYTKPSGLCPLIGDNDNGRLVFLDDTKDVNDHTTHLSTGAILFKRTEFKFTDKPEEETVWLFGTKVQKMFKNIGKKEINSKAFKAGGYYIIRSKNSYLIVDCGDLGLAGMGGHGHNDTLSFELYTGNKTFITDSGSYVYTADYKSRNHFRSTKAHNTVIIDGEEIAPFNEKDLWYIKDITKPKVNSWLKTKYKDFFDGQHEGYKRIGNTIHRRQITFNKKKEVWIVKDILVGSGTHECRLLFHLMPMKLKKNGLEIETRTKDINIIISPKNTKGLNLTIKEDFISESYGKKVKAPVIEYSKKDKLPTEFETEIRVKK